MIFEEINNIKKVLGADNVRRFYFLIPLDLITSLLEIISISIIIPFVIAISDKSRVMASDYAYIVDLYFVDYNQFLLTLVVILVFTSLAATALSIYSNARKISLANQIGQKVSQLQFKKYLLAEYRFHSKVNNTELSKNLMAEVSRFTNNVLIASVAMISKIFFLIIILIFMLTIDPFVSLALIFSLSSIYLIIYKGMRNKLLGNGKKISNSMTNLYSFINESLNGIKETKFYSLENYYLGRYIKNSNTIAERTSSSQIISIVPKSIIEFLVFSTLISVLIYFYTQDNLIENLPVITFFLYSGYRSLPAIQQVYNSSALIRANYESVNRILKFDHLILNDDDLTRSTNLDQINKISFKDISFKYDDQKLLFDKFSLEIDSPGFVAIIGESGSGKSTLVDLMLKLNQPIGGQVLFNQVTYTYGDARFLFAYVPQNIHLADSTLLENILLGDINVKANIDLAEKSLKLSGLSSLIKDLPQGINTTIGENGSNLSGGQRKRLGLARAFYSQKPLLILDEVTSGLDASTEQSLINDLKILSKEKLIILVTHNIGYLDLFDQVINLDDMK